MRKLLSLAILVLVIQTLAQNAWAIDLYAWHAVKELPPLLIGVKDGETPEEAANRYIDSVAADAELKRLFNGKAPELPERNFKKLVSAESAHSVLLLANDPKDYQMSEKAYRIPAFLKSFNSRTTYILPIAYDVGLNSKDAEDLRSKAYRQFSFVVGMGGADVDPALYAENAKGARNVNRRRDISELKFIRGFIESKQGLYVGICRGSQIASVALGYRLVQDIPTEIATDMKHEDGELHEIELLPVRESWLRQSFNMAKTLLVNSYHHQAVDLNSNPDGPLVQTAKSRDGINEAFQSRDGRVLLFQFHPELMDRKEVTTEAGKYIMDQIIATHEHLLQPRARACRELFSNAL